MNEYLLEGLSHAQKKQEGLYRMLDEIDAMICDYEDRKKETLSKIDMYSEAIEALTKFVKEA